MIMRILRMIMLIRVSYFLTTSSLSVRGAENKCTNIFYVSLTVSLVSISLLSIAEILEVCRF